MNPPTLRRSMTDALQPALKPELVSIIKQGTPKPQTALPVFVAPDVADKTSATPSLMTPVEAAPQPKARGVAEKTRAEPSTALVSVNYRLPENIAQALRKASFERKQRKLANPAQQEIVAEALTDWLKANGYLK